jgi:hypothetical protein
VALHGEGRVTVRPAIIDAVRALNECLKAAGYLTRRADTGAYNCRQITGGSGYSLHAYGIAVDHNWQSNPYSSRLITDMPSGAIREIEALNVDGAAVLRWGGRYSGNKDAMHFEVVVPPSVAIRFEYDQQEGLTVAEIEQLIAVIKAQGKLTRDKIDAQTRDIDQALAEIKRIVSR